MAAVDERDKILKKYMNEWDELNLDLIITPASLMPAPLKVKIMFEQIIFSKIKDSMILLHIRKYLVLLMGSHQPIPKLRILNFFSTKFLLFSNMFDGIFFKIKLFD